MEASSKKEAVSVKRTPRKPVWDSTPAGKVLTPAQKAARKRAGADVIRQPATPSRSPAKGATSLSRPNSALSRTASAALKVDDQENCGQNLTGRTPDKSRPTCAGSKTGPQTQALEQGWVGNGTLPSVPSTDTEPDSTARMGRPSPRAVMPISTEALQPAAAAEKHTATAAVAVHPLPMPSNSGTDGGAKQAAGEPAAAAKAVTKKPGGCCAVQ